MNKQDVTAGTSTWTRQRLFDPATIKKSMTITKWQQIKLLFRRNQYAFEDNTMVRYKRMGEVAFILEVRRLIR